MTSSLLFIGKRRLIISYNHTCNNALARTRNVTDNALVDDTFLSEIIFTLKLIKSYFKGSFVKQNLTLDVISHEIYEIRRRLVS